MLRRNSLFWIFLYVIFLLAEFSVLVSPLFFRQTWTLSSFSSCPAALYTCNWLFHFLSMSEKKTMKWKLSLVIRLHPLDWLDFCAVSCVFLFPSIFFLFPAVRTRFMLTVVSNIFQGFFILNFSAELLYAAMSTLHSTAYNEVKG